MTEEDKTNEAFNKFMDKYHAEDNVDEALET